MKGIKNYRFVNGANIIEHVKLLYNKLQEIEQLISGGIGGSGLQQVLDTDPDWEQGPSYYAFNPDSIDIYLQDEEGNNNMEIYNGIGGNMGMYNDKIIDDTRLFESIETRNTGIANDIRKILRLFTYAQDALTFLYSYVNVLTLNTDKGIGIEARLNPSDLAPITAWLKTDNLTEDQTFQFPDKSGTFALLDDIPSAATLGYTSVRLGADYTTGGTAGLININDAVLGTPLVVAHNVGGYFTSANGRFTNTTTEPMKVSLSLGVIVASGAWSSGALNQLGFNISLLDSSDVIYDSIQMIDYFANVTSQKSQHASTVFILNPGDYITVGIQFNAGAAKTFQNSTATYFRFTQIL